MSAAEQSDGWIEWAGGECPVADDAMVQCLLRDHLPNPSAEPDSAGRMDWRHFGTAGDIIAYRVLP